MKPILFLTFIIAMIIGGNLTAHAQAGCLCVPKDSTYNADSLFAIDTCITPLGVPCNKMFDLDNKTALNAGLFTKRYHITFDTSDYIPLAELPWDTLLYFTWNDIDSAFTATRAGFAALEARFGAFVMRKIFPSSTIPEDTRSRAYELSFTYFELPDSLYAYIHTIPGLISATSVPIFLDNQSIPTDRGMKLGTWLNDIQYSYPDTRVPGSHHRLGWQWAHYVISTPMAWEITQGKESIVIGMIDQYRNENVYGELNVPDLNMRDDGTTSGKINNNFLVLNDAHPETYGDGIQKATARLFKSTHSNTTIPIAIAQQNNDNLTFPHPEGGMVGSCPTCKGFGFDPNASLSKLVWGDIPELDFDFTQSTPKVIRRVAITSHSQGTFIDANTSQYNTAKQTYYENYRTLIQNGIVAVAAAGNNQPPDYETDPVFVPAAHVYNTNSTNLDGPTSNPSLDFKIIAVAATQDGQIYNKECNIIAGNWITANTVHNYAVSGDNWLPWDGTHWTGNERFANTPPLLHQSNTYSTFLTSFGTNKFPSTWTFNVRQKAKQKAHIDVCAPGVGVLTFSRHGQEDHLYDWGYGATQRYTISDAGTSLATPLVSGVCGLMLSVNRYMGLPYSTSTGFTASTKDNYHPERGEELQRRVYNAVTFTADKIVDAGTNLVGSSTPSSLTPSGLTQPEYVIQEHDVMHRSWAQRVGFGRVNAYRAVAHAIGNKGIYEYTSSLTLPFTTTGDGYSNENGRPLMHFGNWVNATQTVYQTEGHVFSGEPAYKNNNGKTLVNGTATTLTVPTDGILAIDGIVTSANTTAGNSIVTTGTGKILITGYLQDVNVTGQIKSSALLITSANPSGTGLSLRTSSLTGLGSEIYGIVTLKTNGALEVYNNSECIMQPGSQIDMQGTRNIYVKEGATLTMKSASVISGGAYRKIIVENGAKLIVDGKNVDIFAEVEVLAGGQFILEQNSYLRLDRFTVRSGGTMQCKQGSSLYLNNPAQAMFMTADNYCYGKFLVEGVAYNKVTIDGRRDNPYRDDASCNDVSSGASINILGDLTQPDSNQLKLKFVKFGNIMLQGVDAYIPESIEGATFHLSRYVTPQSGNSGGTYTNDQFRLALIITPTAAANPLLMNRFVVIKDCGFKDNMLISQFNALGLGGDYSSMSTSLSGLKLLNYDYALVENTTFQFLNYGILSENVKSLSLINNSFMRSYRGLHDIGSTVYACSNSISKVQFGFYFAGSPTAILNDNYFSTTETATGGISCTRMLYRNNTFNEFLNAIKNDGGGIANLSYRKPAQADYELFGRNVFTVSPAATIPYPNNFVQGAFDFAYLSDIWLTNGTALLWTACGFNSFAENTTYHVTGLAQPARTLLNGGLNFWHDPLNPLGNIRVPAAGALAPPYPNPVLWNAPGAPLNQSLPPIHDCNGSSQSALCASCYSLGAPPAYSVGGGSPQQGANQTKQNAAMVLGNSATNVMDEREVISDELAMLRNPDSLRSFITKITPSNKDDEFLQSGKHLYRGRAYERLGQLDSARSAYRSITSMNHSSSDSLLAAWLLQKIDVETGNWGGLTNAEAEAAYYKRVAEDIRHKRQTPNKTTDVQSQVIAGNTLGISITRLYPLPVSNGVITIDAESSDNAANVTAEIYSVTGQQLATLWEGNIKKGSSTITMTLRDISSGSYILYLKNSKGETIDFSRVIVSEGQR